MTTQTETLTRCQSCGTTDDLIVSYSYLNPEAAGPLRLYRWKCRSLAGCIARIEAKHAQAVAQ